MIAFTQSTLPKIRKSVDFLNVMTYDLMNRRDSVTEHHSGTIGSENALHRYSETTPDAANLNLGLAFYIKWFKTAGNETCNRLPAIGCRTELMEDPVTGADLGMAGAFSWHDEVPQELVESFERAMANGLDDGAGMDFKGHYYMDIQEQIFWSWDTPDSIQTKLNLFFQVRSNIGGLFAWGLGEDAPRFEHLRAVNEMMQKWESGPGSRLEDRVSEHEEL